MKQKYCSNLLIYFITLIISVTFILLTPVIAYAEDNSSNKIIEITKGWKYRMGNSPASSTGIPLWISENDSSEWKDFNYPGKVPNGRNLLDAWFRVKLPDTGIKNACLLLSEDDQEVEVYLDGKKIYSYGNISAPDKYKRIGSPLILISLPENYQNKNIYFRMHAYVPYNTGLILKLKLAQKSDFILEIINSDIDKIVLVSIFIFIGLITAFLSTVRKVNQKAFLSLGLSSIIIALWIIGRSSVKLLIYNNPKFWFYDVHISNYLMPIGFLMFVERIFAQGEYQILTKKMWQFQILFLMFALAMDLTHVIVIFDLIKVYFILFLLYVFYMIIVVFKISLKGNKEVLIFLCGFSILVLFGIHEFLFAYFRVLPWSRSMLHWGLFAFIMSQLTILTMRFVETYDKLKIYSIEIETKNKTLNQMWKEIKTSRDTLAQWNENLEDIVKQKTYAIQNLLDNAGEGFLSFNDNLLINEEYSIECVKIFGREIYREKFSNLIFPEGEDRNYLELMLKKILNEDKEYKRDIYIPLLPDEKIINSKNIKISYKVIDKNQTNNDTVIMVILNDITDQRVLESKMESESKILKMVVKSVTNYNDFIKFIRDYKYFCQVKINEILDSGNNLQNIIFEIFRTVHTFKGSFSQMDMVNIVTKLHNFETELSQINNNSSNTTLNELRELLSSRNLGEWIEEDMNLLYGILGEEYFKHERALIIDQAKLLAIEDRLISILSTEQLKEVLPQLRQLRYRPFKELLADYQDLVAKLSEKLEKPMNSIIFTGPDIYVNAEKYHNFTASLVHIFRNIMDHGIEDLNSRVLSGKNEAGSIICKILETDKNIQLSIADDGIGLDVDKIKETAVQKGLYDLEAVNSLDESDALKLIFLDGFSTRKTISELSGRGVGLAAVKESIEKINGSIKVTSKYGEGTEFTFLLPILN